MARQQNSAHTLAPPLQEETLPVAEIDDVDVQSDELPATNGQSAHDGDDSQADVHAEELNFDEQFYPARPARLRPRARLRVWPWQRRSPGNGPRSEVHNSRYPEWTDRAVCHRGECRFIPTRGDVPRFVTAYPGDAL